MWTSDGLVVQAYAVEPRRQLAVDVWQICVANHYPALLAGANDALLTVTRAESSGPGRQPCANVGASVPAETLAAWNRHWAIADALQPPMQGGR